MSFGYETVHEAAMALIRAGTEIFSIGDIEDAQIFFDASHALLIAPSSTDHHIMELAREKLETCRVKCLPLVKPAVPPASCHCQRVNEAPSQFVPFGTTTAPTSKTSQQVTSWHNLLLPKSPISPDLYEQGKCDVGPRLLNQPVCPSRLNNVTSLSFLQAIIMFNKGLVCHSKGQLDLAETFYRSVSDMASSLMAFDSPTTDQITVTELTMRAYNNLGVLYYRNHLEMAEPAIRASVQFAKQLASYHPTRYNLEYATVLSNYCRILFMRGDQQSILHHVQEIARLRRTMLPMEHADVAAAIWNVGATMYHTGQNKTATFYLMQYLGIASQRSLEDGIVELDAVPALVLLLIIQNKEKSSQLSQELVAGLCNLSGKRRDEGRSSPEVASILNYIGTILFHQQEYHHALVFFLEELRLEDKKQDDMAMHSSSPSVISVTCNNVGRIMQELGRYKEAVFFYERSLKEWYGADETRQGIDAQLQFSQEKIHQSKNKNAVINLYSTVWYNLGLISDKVGSFDDAMHAFQMALALRKLMVGSYHADVACLLYNIGVLQMEKDRLDDAYESLVQALRIRSSCDAGQLSDEHLVRTLQKLACLLKAKNHWHKALETYEEIIEIHESSPTSSLLLEAGQAWNAIAEIYHARNDMLEAIDATTRGVACLRRVFDPTKPLECAEQLIGALLLQASLYHEVAEPIRAGSIIHEALELARPLQGTNVASLTSLLDLTFLLSKWHCAPVA